MQTTYDLYQANAFAGLIGDSSNRVIYTGVAEGTINFGVPVKRGTKSDQGVLPLSAEGDAALVIGIAVSTQKSQLYDFKGTVNYASTESVPCITFGPVWVAVVDAVKAGDPVKVVEKTGAFSSAGVEVSGPRKMQYLTSTSGPGFAMVEVR
ncbi:MAG: hypothetical protein LBV73_27310 [Paraburkholderia sp.]|jgi:hypothetical protein|nr:hypothetical protein [Paraburkholderia sp.]